MTFLTYILSFAFTLGVIVLLHELGHFVVAKAFGVRVLTFSIGFGNRVAGFQRGGTDYRISALPLGGYVRMGGEQPEEATDDPQDFVNKPRWKRILVYLAGPAMNFVLSLSVMAALFMVGIYIQGLQDTRPLIGRVDPGSAGEKAGFQPDDLVLAVDAKKVALWKDFAFIVATAADRQLKVEVQRAGGRQELLLTPTREPRDGYGETGIYPKLQPKVAGVVAGKPAEQAGLRAGDTLLKVDGQPISDMLQFVKAIEEKPGQKVDIEVLRQEQILSVAVITEAVEGKGKIGVQLGYFRRLPLGEALVESWRYNLEIIGKTFQVIGKLFHRELEAKTALSGPIEMAKMSGDAAKEGLDSLFLMMAFLSISIGILNLLPIPLLDGGQIFILLVESLLRRDLSMRVKERFAQAGFMILMVLMATVIYFDLSKNLPALFGGGG